MSWSTTWRRTSNGAQGRRRKRRSSAGVKLVLVQGPCGCGCHSRKGLFVDRLWRHGRSAKEEKEEGETTDFTDDTDEEGGLGKARGGFLGLGGFGLGDLTFRVWDQMVGLGDARFGQIDPTFGLADQMEGP